VPVHARALFVQTEPKADGSVVEVVCDEEGRAEPNVEHRVRSYVRDEAALLERDERNERNERVARGLVREDVVVVVAALSGCVFLVLGIAFARAWLGAAVAAWALAASRSMWASRPRERPSFRVFAQVRS